MITIEGNHINEEDAVEDLTITVEKEETINPEDLLDLISALRIATMRHLKQLNRHQDFRDQHLANHNK